eukprot:scaffold148163_cov20-Tisochrysis_lutea.AAC.1
MQGYPSQGQLPDILISGPVLSPDLTSSLLSHLKAIAQENVAYMSMGCIYQVDWFEAVNKVARHQGLLAGCVGGCQRVARHHFNWRPFINSLLFECMSWSVTGRGGCQRVA